MENMISSRYAACIMTLIITGSNLIFGITSEKQNDQWIPIILSMFMSIPFIFIYARIIKLYEGKSIFEVMEILFGKIFGKILIGIVAFFGFHAAARLLKEFSEFISLTALRETPQIPIIIMISLVCLYLAKSKISVLGKFSLVVFLIGYAINIFVFIIAIPFMKIQNILPIISQSWGEIFQSALNFMCLTALEIVFGFAIMDKFSKNNNVKKIYFSALVFGYFLIFLVIIRTILILGSESSAIYYFPRYVAIRVINAGSFFERIEKLTYYTYLLFGVVKIVIFLYTGCRAISKIFEIENYQEIMLPSCFLTISTCAVLSDSIMQIFSFFSVYYFYSVPFQVIIPIFMWIIAEVKTRIQKKEQKEIAV
ncbi:MAG: endospore germination permease [Clostridiales bacterium]|jgi:spore germination protein KB|nr:endospore germination permease [Clostridiales bacterium]